MNMISKIIIPLFVFFIIFYGAKRKINISFIIAKDAVPDIGRNIAIGRISIGIWLSSNKGFKKLNAPSKNLLSKKIFTAKTIAIIVGAIWNTIISPSLAPTKKES